jgi:hypothetical protein
MRSFKEKKEIVKRAESIRHAFGNRSLFSAIKYILKYG